MFALKLSVTKIKRNNLSEHRSVGRLNLELKPTITNNSVGNINVNLLLTCRDETENHDTEVCD